MEFKLSQSYLPRTLRCPVFSSTSSHKQFHLHVQMCRCQIHGISSNADDPTKKIMVHVVKEGETMTSISKLYGVPICDIAAVNEEVVDADLVFEGQQLNIPSSIAAPVQKGKSEMTQSPESDFERAPSLGLYSRFLNLKNSTILSFHHLSYACKYHHAAKTTGYFLVLVPLIAFCIRCIMGALNNKHATDLDHSSANESESHRHRSKRMRWKTALLDLTDPDELETNPIQDFDHFIEDEEEIDSNDLSHTYRKLEDDYQKFLSECGISKWGYWRGGSSK